MAAKKYCSFCGKAAHEVARLIDGPVGIAVCNECIDLMHGMIHKPQPAPGMLAVQLAEHRMARMKAPVPVTPPPSSASPEGAEK